MAIKSKKLRLSSREKNKFRIRKKAVGTAERPRLSVFRSGKHTYAQLISDESGVTLAATSTRDSEVAAAIPQAIAAFEKNAAKEANGESADTLNVNATRTSKSVAAALAVGVVLGKLAVDKKITQVVFDRNGFVYHGRIRAVAEGARSAGLKL